MKNNRLIWIIDRQRWPRALLRAELIERGFDVDGFKEMPEALSTLRAPGSVIPQVIVLELREQDIREDDLNKLIQTGFPLIILGGETELNEQIIKMHHWAAVLKRPLTIGEVADKVEEIAGDNGD